jgi:membrane-associated phospholipid phosphatase
VHLVTAPAAQAALEVSDAPQRGRRARWWSEILVIVWLCWVYDAINNLAPLRQATAYSHAHGIWDFERSLHLDPEATLDHWLTHHHTVALLVSTYYDNAHFVVTLGLVGWLWWRHPTLYRPMRTSLVLTNVVALTVFWLYPTAPPRLFDPSRYTDVVAATHAVGSFHSGALATAANQLAAMPSLHIAWAVWSAYALWQILGRGRPRLRWLVWVYPVITAGAVMSTGNHWLLDVLAGLGTTALATLVANRWQGWATARQARRALVPVAVPSS